MTSDIDKLLSEIRAGHQPESRSPRIRLAVFTGIIGAAAILLSAGVLAFGAVATLATPQSHTVDAAAEGWPGITGQPERADTLGATDAASPTATPTATAIPAFRADGTSPLYTADTDPATIPLPPDVSADELTNAKLWLTQQSIIFRCMKDQGYSFAYTPYWLMSKEELDFRNWNPDPYMPQDGTDASVAMWGAADQPMGDDYDWRQAGCVGYAVHVTGQDDAN